MRSARDTVRQCGTRKNIYGRGAARRGAAIEDAGGINIVTLYAYGVRSSSRVIGARNNRASLGESWHSALVVWCVSREHKNRARARPNCQHRVLTA